MSNYQKTVYDLLTDRGYPMAWIQGHHTRIILSTNDVGKIVFQILSKDKDSRYTIEKYDGINESVAIETFERSENE